MQTNDPATYAFTPRPAEPVAPTQTDEQRANAFRDAGLTEDQKKSVIAGTTAASNQRSVDTAGATGVVADNGTAREDERVLGDRIRNEVMNPSPIDLKYLDEYSDKLGQRRIAEEKNIQTNFDNLKTSTERQQQGEVGSTSSAIARAGGYLGVSGSGTGVLLNLANTHRAEIASIEAKRQDALSAARSAYEDKEFAIAQKRYDEAKQYKQLSFDRQQEYFNTVKKSMDEMKKTERQREVNNLIYEAINGGKTEPKEIFGALNGMVTPEEIDTFFTKLKPIPKSTDLFKPTNEQSAIMLGSGLSAKQVNDITKEINTTGYSDALKAKLTPEQRRVMDSILVLKQPKPSGTGTGGLKISYVPEKLASIVAQRGAANVYDDLISPEAPDWFNAYVQQTIKEIENSQRKTLGEASRDKIRTKAWAEFKASPDISAFLKQVNKKIFGTIDDGTDDFGALSGAGSSDSAIDLTE